MSRIETEGVSGPIATDRSVAAGDASTRTTTRLFANPDPAPVPVEPVVAAPVAPTPPVAGRKPEPVVTLSPTPPPTPAPPVSPRPTPKPEPSPVVAPRTAGKPYVVSAGDSLYKIVQAAYGTRKQSVVDVVFAANRDKLSDPHALRVGQTLTLPVINGQSPDMAALTAATAKTDARSVKSPEPAGAPTGKETKAPVKGTEVTTEKSVTASKVKETGGDSRKVAKPGETQKAWRWYQVKKGDRYATIAERELGDKDRWSELYELNKAVFPDSSAIRSGVRIKIPVDAKKK
jgi:nucleoid-associated protein YgaU